jgi:hypothetical protein
MAVDYNKVFAEQLYQIGEGLITALNREAGLSESVRRSPSDANLAEEWRRARKAVDRYTELYVEMVACTGFAEHPIRTVVEARLQMNAGPA